MSRRDPLLPSLPPRGLSRDQAAAYLGISTWLFDELVKDGRMPPPTRIRTRLVWDRLKVDAAFAALANEPGDDGWDDVAL